MSDESTSGRDYAAPKRPVAWTALVVFVIAGMLIWQHLVPVECALSFDIPPTLRSAQGKGLTRKDIRALHAYVHDSEGQLVAKSDLELPEGIKGPVAPPIILRLPQGDYTARVQLTGSSGHELQRTASFSLQEDGFKRVELLAAPMP